MEILRLNSKGESVLKWQNFLIGQGFDTGGADGLFGEDTFNATKKFQSSNGLNPDGVVGNITAGKAMLLGFGILEDTSKLITSANWPSKPAFKPLVSNEERAKLFGSFSYKHKPIPGNYENIEVTDNWAKKNIVTVPIPQLSHVLTSKKISFHQSGAKQVKQLFIDWEKANLLHLILAWNGSYVPRFIRGSNTVLSNHSFGTAFDINYEWNKLGALPALVGQKGSVRQLVEIANKNGFYWGGHFTRLDGMHFELAKLL